MANQEIYVRGASDPEARGPFSLEQLVSLVEAGQVNAETYYYDAATEQWLLISSSPEMKAALWPEKKKMGFKQTEFKALNVEKAGSAPAITVHDMLAAAEGKTDDTKGKKDKGVSQMAASIWGTRSATAICMLGAVALILPGIDALIPFDPAKLIDRPYIIFGVIDVFIGLSLLLGMITFYPFVRFFAALSLGFLGFLFMTQGQLNALIAIAAGSVGLYFCTIFLSYIPLAVSALVGLGGMAMLATMSYS